MNVYSEQSLKSRPSSSAENVIKRTTFFDKKGSKKSIQSIQSFFRESFRNTITFDKPCSNKTKKSSSPPHKHRQQEETSEQVNKGTEITKRKGEDFRTKSYGKE